jgi:hypothetical protein
MMIDSRGGKSDFESAHAESCCCRRLALVRSFTVLVRPRVQKFILSGYRGSVTPAIPSRGNTRRTCRVTFERR